jgi:hypothetical protein
MRPEQFGSQCPTNEKVELVMRLLSGETPAELSRETGRPRKQLSAWRQQFLAGGETYLDGRGARGELERLRVAEAELSTRVAELEAENRMRSRQVALLREPAHEGSTHPYCSEDYARALEEPGVERMRVAALGTYVMVREGETGIRQATAVQPFGSLDPSADPGAGLEALRKAEIGSFSLITDPMWSAELSELRAAFDLCRPFKPYYAVDREVGLEIRKRHRNRINQARRVGEIKDVSLADHLDRWLELYRCNVDRRQIARPFTPAYFAQLAEFEGLRTVALIADDEIVTMSLWIVHGDTMYFHDGASDDAGMAISGAYATFAHAIDSADCRYVLLGGSAGIRDEPESGLSVFKRGFANTTVVSYICNATLTDAP